MIVYQSDGTVRATIEVSEDAELLLQVSDECSFTTKITMLALSVIDVMQMSSIREIEGGTPISATVSARRAMARMRINAAEAEIERLKQERDKETAAS